MKKIFNKLLILSCVATLTVPAISAFAADIEPRVPAAVVCLNCNQLGYSIYKTVKTTPEAYGYSGCSVCDDIVQIMHHTITYYGNCSSCGYSNQETEHVYSKACGH